jgi:hypothetical protein
VESHPNHLRPALLRQSQCRHFSPAKIIEEREGTDRFHVCCLCFHSHGPPFDDCLISYCKHPKRALLPNSPAHQRTERRASLVKANQRANEAQPTNEGHPTNNNHRHTNITTTQQPNSPGLPNPLLHPGGYVYQTVSPSSLLHNHETSQQSGCTSFDCRLLVTWIDSNK